VCSSDLYSPVSSSYQLTNGDSVDNTELQVSRLAPSILNNEQSKFDGQGITAITYPTSLKSLYVYDYIMILKVSTTYKVNIGDVIRLESDVIDGNFVVNRIKTLNTFIAGGPTTRFAPRPYKYVYMFTNFNDNINTELTKTTNTIVITNLNKYNTVNELEHNFNIHPISNGYELVYNNVTGQIPSIDISAKFNNLTSYYNLATNVFANDNLTSVMATMSYTDGFLKFGYTPTYNLLDYLEEINDKTVSKPKFYADKEYLAMPDYRSITSKSPNNITISKTRIDTNGLSFSYSGSNKIQFGENLRLEWESIFINTFVDVTIYTEEGGPYTTERLLVMKKYTETEISSTYDGTIIYAIEFHKSLNYKKKDKQTNNEIKNTKKFEKK